RACDASVVPDWSPPPLSLFVELSVWLVYEFAHFPERLPAPVPKLLDPLVDECRGRFHPDGTFHVHLQLSLLPQPQIPDNPGMDRVDRVGTRGEPVCLPAWLQHAEAAHPGDPA